MYLGIEIGGTKLQIGLGPGDGTLASLWRGSVEPAQGADGIRRQITSAVPELLQKAGLPLGDVRGAGIGFGGPVDDRDHTVIKSHQIEGWDHFPLADWISDLLSLPAALGNDADCAGLAEALFGAGKGLSPIFYITIGSGIGGGLIINGEIYRGCGRGAAEIGHTTVFAVLGEHGGTYDDWGPLEAYSSGWAIEEYAKEQLSRRSGRDSVLHQWFEDTSQITAKDVARAAQENDPLAQGTLNRALHYLAEAICQVIALVCPRRIILGGGVSLMGDELLFEPLRELIAERVFRPFADCYDIVPAALGEEVVIHGALALARKRLGGTGQ